MDAFESLNEMISRGERIANEGKLELADTLFSEMLIKTNVLKATLVNNLAVVNVHRGRVRFAKKLLSDLLKEGQNWPGCNFDHVCKNLEKLEKLEKIATTSDKVPSNFEKIVSQYKTLFFSHIPKTGGKYIMEESLEHEMGKKINYIPHPVCTSRLLDVGGFKRAWVETCIHDKGFRESLVFAVVRNPFDYLVSMYKYGFPYTRKYMEEDKWASSFGWPFHSFEQFIRAYCDPKYPWMLKHQHNFLFFQLFDDEGTCRCHFILRNECLDEGLKILCRPFGITGFFSGKRINASRQPDEGDYKQFYNRELCQLVEAKCSRELRAFGYSFHDHDGRIIIDPSNIKYNPHTDDFQCPC